jgi:hypothetical protein
VSARALLVALALACAGCGADAGGRPEATVTPPLDTARYGPAHAVAQRDRPPAPRPHAAAPSAAVAHALAAGTVGVVDLDGAVGVRPATLATDADGGLEALQWTRWDATGAEGQGELRVLDCQPNCAAGQSEQIPARVTLSNPHTCAGARYFDAATVTIDPARSPAGGAQPTSYLRAPC